MNLAAIRFFHEGIAPAVLWPQLERRSSSSEPARPRSVLFLILPLIPHPPLHPACSPTCSPFARLPLFPFAAHCPDVLFMVSSHQLLDGAAAEGEDEEVCVCGG